MRVRLFSLCCIIFSFVVFRGCTMFRRVNLLIFKRSDVEYLGIYVAVGSEKVR